MGIKMKKKLQSTFHSIDLFGIICSTDYKKVWKQLQTSHLEVNHLQITCWRILGNKAKKGDFNYMGKHWRRNVQLFTFILFLARFKEKLLIGWNAFGFEWNCVQQKGEMGDTKEKVGCYINAGKN